MDHQANPLTVILVLGALHGVALGMFFFFHGRGDRGANIVLGILLVVFSINFGLPKIVKDYHTQFPHLIAAAYPLPFLLGPLLYLYAKRLTSGREHNLKMRLHFIPFLTVTFYLMPFYLQSEAEKLDFIHKIRTTGLPVDWLALSGVKTLHLLGYLAATFWMLKQHGRQVRAVFSSIERIHLRWLRYLVFGTGCVWFVQFVFYLGFMFHKLVDPYIVADYASGYATAIFVYSIGYMGLRQPEIFGMAIRELNIKKYHRSGLTPDKAERYLKKLLTYMEQNKPYRNSELTLPQLASEMDIPPNHLSQIINEKLQQNFFDFINKYRVDEVKQRLANPGDNHFTILAMAFDAGFNSKSAFYSAFQKHTGTSPSRYPRTVQK
ncbi:AraC family transcriptional regulator [candidate division KSB1 bacterium]|nr:AraC family transcriptional regulator [candidate division KSB1 bacterium]NIS23912.1 AraC family transcriptional regulator [candidate division KSB1 bacterium]NIT70829.1 AraC family transcriptional regulator [candidate division KSB1 bacterium]NIU24561.1 AraC family transcriptional regulator [candidate division KSB1 bacterium]NIU94515.1 helix-turn-helix domain-containing protein [candidate division KSB1 bacterium]